MRRYVPIAVIAALAAVAITLAIQPRLFAQSQGGAEAMSAANQLYESSRFGDAALAYEQLVDQGYRDARFYYNLGNAYFKEGDLGRAVLSYVRAKQLAPRDQDVDANLEIARAQTRALLDTGDKALVVRLLALLWSSLTLNELALVTLALWLTLLALAATALFVRPGGVQRISRFATVAVGLVLIVSLVSLGSRLPGRIASSRRSRSGPASSGRRSSSNGPPACRRFAPSRARP